MRKFIESINNNRKVKVGYRYLVTLWVIWLILAGLWKTFELMN